MIDYSEMRELLRTFGRLLTCSVAFTLLLMIDYSEMRELLRTFGRLLTCSVAFTLLLMVDNSEIRELQGAVLLLLLLLLLCCLAFPFHPLPFSHSLTLLPVPMVVYSKIRKKGCC